MASFVKSVEIPPRDTTELVRRMVDQTRLVEARQSRQTA
jgi:hypothetical protein